MIRVYKYGLLPPTEGADIVREQMFAAHKYRNELTAIGRGTREYIRSVISECGDEEALVHACEAALEVVSQANRVIKAQRAKTRSRSEEAAQRDVLREARERAKAARAALSMYRRQIREDPEISAKLAVVCGVKTVKADGEKKRDNKVKNDGLAAQLVRSARGQCGVYWGTYLLVEAAHGDAMGAPLYDGTQPNDPRFVRWSGKGRVGVQFQKGLDVADLFSNDTRVRIVPVDERAWTSPVRGERRRLARTSLRLRVSSEGRAPVWASWPMIMHREIPAGARIKLITASVHKIGPREEWSCEITVDEPARTATGAQGTIAVHLGWLETEAGLRVATWMDNTGETGQVVVSAEARTQVPSKITADGLVSFGVNNPRGMAWRGGGALHEIRKADELRSIRDKKFDAALAELVSWLRTEDVPEWMLRRTVRNREAVPSQAQALAYLSGWKAQAKLAALAHEWRNHRWDGDTEAFEALEAWRYHDFHLWQWESSQRTGGLRRRKNEYRVLAAQLGERYATVLMDGVKLDTIARRKKTEDKVDPAAPRANRQAAAAGEFRDVVENAAKVRGADVQRIAPAGLSTTCPVCGMDDPAHKDVDRHEFGCTECGYTNDLDRVALLNMLYRGGCKEEVASIIERAKKAGAAFKQAPQQDPHPEE